MLQYKHINRFVKVIKKGEINYGRIGKLIRILKSEYVVEFKDKTTILYNHDAIKLANPDKIMLNDWVYTDEKKLGYVVDIDYNSNIVDVLVDSKLYFYELKTLRLANMDSKVINLKHNIRDLKNETRKLNFKLYFQKFENTDVDKLVINYKKNDLFYKNIGKLIGVNDSGIKVSYKYNSDEPIIKTYSNEDFDKIVYLMPKTLDTNNYVEISESFINSIQSDYKDELIGVGRIKDIYRNHTLDVILIGNNDIIIRVPDNSIKFIK